MKIAHYMKGFVEQGGIATYLRRVTHAQANRGHTVFLFDRAQTDDLPSTPVAQYPHINSIANDDGLFDAARNLSLDILHLHTPVDYRNASGCVTIRTLHGHHSYCPSGTKYLSSRNAPCDRTYGLWGCAWSHLVDRCGSVRPIRMYEGFKRVAEEVVTAKLQASIAVSNYTKSQMVRTGFPESLLTVIHNPAPSVQMPVTEAPLAEKGQARFAFLGRLVPGKGVDWLVRTVSVMNINAHFDIIGDGYDKVRIMRLAADLGVAERFTWWGWIHNEADISERLAASRALIFPSLWQEPAGFVTMEAAATARAVIASDVGGISEYARRLENALLVAPGDIRELGSAILSLIEDRGLATRLGYQGWTRLSAGELSMEGHLDALEQVYSNVRETVI